jgi:hypothetical protein
VNKAKTDTKPCLFGSLVCIYPEDLLKCETKENQRWRNASKITVIHRINLFVPYITELTTLKDYLENYSICERHYNQIIVNNALLNKFKNNAEANERSIKRHRIFNSSEVQPSITDEDELSVSEIHARVPLSDSNNDILFELSQANKKLSQNVQELQEADHQIQNLKSNNDNLLLELSQAKNLLINLQFENIQNTQNLREASQQIKELQSQIRRLNREKGENEQLIAENIYLQSQIKNLGHEKEILTTENNYLKDRWNTQYDTQVKRIDAIIKIA